MRSPRNSFFKDSARKRLNKPAESSGENENEKRVNTDQKDTLLSQFLESFNNCSDLNLTEFNHLAIKLYYFSYLIDKTLLDQYFSKLRELNQEDLEGFLQKSEFTVLKSVKEIEEAILSGFGILFFNDKPYELKINDGETRAISPSETETVILGAHDAFVESISTNLSLIRRRMLDPKLKAIQLKIGKSSKNTVYMLYLEGVAADSDIEELKRRLNSIENEAIADSNMLVQYIDEHPYSPFPQFYVTERPDIAVYKLYDGKIIGLLDNSPYAFCTPVSFFEFMESMDDFGQRWIAGTFIKILRYIAIMVTLLFTALYVSVTTFHYEMIPQALLPTILESRSRVPFPPVIEALFLEFLLELLREAGARLPTKVGQTIGIVGGIVIGQAAVEAGITSNILIIVVAASAIASFVVPSYLMSASLRVVRFAFIVSAGFWGNIGMVFCMGILIVHLAGLTNLKSPYLLPISPTYPSFFKYTLLRGPLKKKN